MTDEELKAKIAKLEAQNEKLTEEIEELKKQLRENKASDDQRHKEIKEIQKEHHKENLTWGKIGALGTPLTILLTILATYFKKNGKNEGNGSKTKENKGESKPDLAGIAEIIREVKK